MNKKGSGKETKYWNNVFIKKILLYFLFEICEAGRGGGGGGNDVPDMVASLLSSLHTAP